jgi:hypothetical protein
LQKPRLSFIKNGLGAADGRDRLLAQSLADQAKQVLGKPRFGGRGPRVPDETHDDFQYLSWVLWAKPANHKSWTNCCLMLSLMANSYG